MHQFWEKVEHYNTKLIAPALIVLLGIIVYELFIHVENHTVELVIKITDTLIVTIFIIDLIFLAHKAKSATFFFKKHWLDVIAVFPFAIFFNLINTVYRVAIATERIVLGQALIHETVEATRGAKILAEGGKFPRFIRIFARIIRIVTKSRLFTKIHHSRRKKHQKARKLKED